MAVRRPMERVQDTHDHVDIEALIDRGAPVKGEMRQEEEKQWKMINLRISSEMLAQVDKAVGERVGITRTGWILESIHEKLKREK